MIWVGQWALLNCHKCSWVMQTKFDANLSAAIFYNGTAHSCFDIWRDFVECADPTGCGTGLASMAWDYQVYTYHHRD